MKPPRSPACAGLNGRVRQGAIAVSHMAFIISAFAALSGCEQNSLCAAAAAEGRCRLPVQQHDHALSRSHRQHRADQERRSRGPRAGLPAVDQLQGRRFVKEGTPLFTIEPETYKLKLEQAQAAEAGAQASLKQAEADYKRQADLVTRQAVSQATLDTSTSSTATTPRPICSRPRPTPRSRRSQLSATPMSSHRSTASSARTWSRSANWSARPRRPSLRPSCSLIRSM